MKYFFLFLIDVYQKLISPILKNIIGVNKVCRFPLSCSEYSKKAILNFGLIKGGYLSLLRIIKCQPFYKI